MWRALWSAAALALLLPAIAIAAPRPGSGVAVQDFATGFEFDASSRIGPFGVAFDDAGRLYALDRHVYRFDGDGSAADNQLSSEPVGTPATGLAFGNDGRLYAARHRRPDGEVVELDPLDGSVIRVVAGGLRCPTALATDPVSGDLFVSTVDCGRAILRITDPGGQPTVTQYVANFVADGLAFAPTGELYVAHEADADRRTVSVIDGTASATPGRRTGLAAVPYADGVALGRPGHSGAASPFVVVNRTDGTITKVDLQGGPQRDLVTGGSRGDLVAVGPDGCLYATQTDRILKITNTDHGCKANNGAGTNDGSSPAPALEQGLLPTWSAAGGVLAAARCSPNRRLKVGLRFAGKRLRSATVYLDGRRVKTVRGRALRHAASLRGLPGRTFTVTIRATTHAGRSVVRRTRYSACGRHVLRAKKRAARRH